MFCLWRDLASLTEMSKRHQTWDKKEEINYKKPSIHPIRIMYACKFSDLFRSQLCTWLIQSTVLCWFTLIFLLHSLKCSLSIHHIFHQLVCWVIISNKRFLLISAQFVLFVSLNTLNHSVCMSIHLVAHFWSVAYCCCLHLVARSKKYTWRGGEARRSLQGRLPKGCLQENSSEHTQEGHRQEKNAAFMIFINITLLMKYGHREATWYCHRW